MITLIDKALLDEVSAEAQASPRRRKNRNFHDGDGHPAHRLLNAVEPDSYIIPHRHLEATKDESVVVLRGRLGLVVFDDAGGVVRTAALPATEGANIPHGTWHTALALEPGTVFFEAKAGPYRPIAAHERAAWAPAEGDPAAAAYLQRLQALFGA
jgi:cupin fold WbuC family metalloprotein